jgi:hypothetical protein
METKAMTKIKYKNNARVREQARSATFKLQFMSMMLRSDRVEMAEKAYTEVMDLLRQIETD